MEKSNTVIEFSGYVSLCCNGSEIPVKVETEVVPEDEESARVVDLKTIKQQALMAVMDLAKIRTLQGLRNHLAEGGHIILNGISRYFLDKGSTKITKL